jgi:hypothetical protein
MYESSKLGVSSRRTSHPDDRPLQPLRVRLARAVLMTRVIEAELAL